MKKITMSFRKKALERVGLALLFFAAGFLAREAMLSGWSLPKHGGMEESRVALMSGDVSLDDDPRLGSGDAEVKIVVFSEFDCPFSQRAVSVVEKIHETYGDSVLIAFRDFPLDFHPNAKKAAEAAECADEQGMFWEYHDRLFETQGSHEIAELKAYAEEIGLETQAFGECLESGRMSDEVEEDMAAGVEAGVSGTPTFFVNGEKVVGAQPFETFEEKIEAALG